MTSKRGRLLFICNHFFKSKNEITFSKLKYGKSSWELRPHPRENLFPRLVSWLYYIQEKYFLPPKYFEIFLEAVLLEIWKSIQKNHIIQRINEWWNSIQKLKFEKKFLKRGGIIWWLSQFFENLLKKGEGYYLIGVSYLTRHCHVFHFLLPRFSRY